MLEAWPFKHIVVADSEFDFGGHETLEEAGRSGERPRPTSMAARELRTDKTWRLFQGEFGSEPPFPIDASALFVAFFASADLGCFKALTWPMPVNVIDPFVEFRNRTNGRPTRTGNSFLGALEYFGLSASSAAEKDEHRLRIIRGGPWSADDRENILNYCAEDVNALARLLLAMAPQIDLPRALLRGRFMKAVAAMEWAGIPIDIATLALLLQYWTEIQDELIAAVDAEYHCFDGRTFRAERWAQYLSEHRIPWPLLESGNLSLSDDTFRQMAKAYPAVSPMRSVPRCLIFG
jgi:hypothetical protein